MPLIRYPIQQHAYVVDDIDAAMAQWTEMTGAGPFWISRGHLGREHTYRGKPFDEPLTYAFGAGQQTLGEGGDKLPYAPLPATLVTRNNAQLATMTCNGSPIS